jgi:hypothetical protein
LDYVLFLEALAFFTTHGNFGRLLDVLQLLVSQSIKGATMTKSQIKAELRREAMQPYPMFVALNGKAWDEALSYTSNRRIANFKSIDDKRTFFLLVAEAL